MAATKMIINPQPIAGSIGATIHEVDLTQPLDKKLVDAIYQAFHDYLVICLPQSTALSLQNISDFAKYFGNLDDNPFVFPFKIPSIEGFPEIYNNIKEADNTGVNIGGFWHADVTYREKPHKASVLYAKEIPDYGGDTMFANQYLAYETLPDDLKVKLSTMNAVHTSTMPHGRSAARFASVGRENIPEQNQHQIEKAGVETVVADVEETIHPVIRTHPETGKKLLYVNRAFTSRFEGMTIEESLPLLEQLWSHASQAELTCRIRWAQNTVIVWDNCATHHYAINDYYGKRRHMQRVSIHED